MLASTSLLPGLGAGAGLAGLQISLPTAALQGLAAGCLLYLVTVGLVGRERGRRLPGLVQLAGFTTGFLAVLLLELQAGQGRVEDEELELGFLPDTNNTTFLLGDTSSLPSPLSPANTSLLAV